MAVGVTTNLDGIRRRFSQQNFDRARYLTANQMMVDMNERFVPMRDQYLRDSAHVAPDGSEIVWSTVYARRHYYNQFSNYTTPGTGPYWDLAAKSLYMSEWKKVFERGLRA